MHLPIVAIYVLLYIQYLCYCKKYFHRNDFSVVNIIMMVGTTNNC